MDITRTVVSQFNAALSMMEETVSSCPDELWNEPVQANPFWRVAYHALFYVDLYLQPSEEELNLWKEARTGYQYLGPTPFPPHEHPVADNAYRQEELLAYIGYLRSLVDSTVPTLDLDSPSGFHWLPFDKMELLIYNLRHLQQHVGDLSTILLTRANLEIHWVGKGPS